MEFFRAVALCLLLTGCGGGPIIDEKTGRITSHGRIQERHTEQLKELENSRWEAEKEIRDLKLYIGVLERKIERLETDK